MRSREVLVICALYITGHLNSGAASTNDATLNLTSHLNNGDEGDFSKGKTLDISDLSDAKKAFLAADGLPEEKVQVYLKSKSPAEQNDGSVEGSSAANIDVELAGATPVTENVKKGALFPKSETETLIVSDGNKNNAGKWGKREKTTVNVSRDSRDHKSLRFERLKSESPIKGGGSTIFNRKDSDSQEKTDFFNDAKLVNRASGSKLGFKERSNNSRNEDKTSTDGQKTSRSFHFIKSDRNKENSTVEMVDLSSRNLSSWRHLGKVFPINKSGGQTSEKSAKSSGLKLPRTKKDDVSAQASNEAMHGKEKKKLLGRSKSEKLDEKFIGGSGEVAQSPETKNRKLKEKYVNLGNPIDHSDFTVSVMSETNSLDEEIDDLLRESQESDQDMSSLPAIEPYLPKLGGNKAFKGEAIYLTGLIRIGKISWYRPMNPSSKAEDYIGNAISSAKLELSSRNDIIGNLAWSNTGNAWLSRNANDKITVDTITAIIGKWLDLRGDRVVKGRGGSLNFYNSASSNPVVRVLEGLDEWYADDRPMQASLDDIDMLDSERGIEKLPEVRRHSYQRLHLQGAIMVYGAGRDPQQLVIDPNTSSIWLNNKTVDSRAPLVDSGRVGFDSVDPKKPNLSKKNPGSKVVSKRKLHSNSANVEKKRPPPNVLPFIAF